MFYFRFHRGGFNESMQTKKKFDELWEVIEFCSDYCDCLISEIIVQYYSYDTRLKTDCYLVSCHHNGKYYIVGFCWEERSKNG